MLQTVLIADGDSGVREQLKWCLRTAGYHVVTAQDRFETMAALMARRVHLLLLDTAMAGAGSDAVLQQVSAGGHFDRVPILMIASNAHSAPREFAVLLKPIAPAELLSIVNGMIGPPERGHTPRPSLASDNTA